MARSTSAGDAPVRATATTTSPSPPPAGSAAAGATGAPEPMTGGKIVEP